MVKRVLSKASMRRARQANRAKPGSASADGIKYTPWANVAPYSRGVESKAGRRTVSRIQAWGPTGKPTFDSRSMEKPAIVRVPGMEQRQGLRRRTVTREDRGREWREKTDHVSERVLDDPDFFFQRHTTRSKGGPGKFTGRKWDPVAIENIRARKGASSIEGAVGSMEITTVKPKKYIVDGKEVHLTFKDGGARVEKNKKTK